MHGIAVESVLYPRMLMAFLAEWSGTVGGHVVNRARRSGITTVTCPLSVSNFR